MGGKWKKEKFSELCTITRGGSPRPIHNYIMDKGIPWVKIADATASNSRTINSTKEYIKSTGKQKSREVFPGDLILSNSATPGLPKFMGIYACIHDGWLLLRDFNGLHKEFCYYFLLHERENLVSQGNGSVFTNLKTDILKNHVVDVPTLSEQRAIAHILGTLDDKIELNRQMAQTLESIARAIFKSWFVDFDPVKAKMEGKQPEGMSEEVAALFPDKFVESKLGMIPEGWASGKFSDISENIRINIRKDAINPNDCYIGLEHIPRKSLFLNNWGIGADVTSNKHRFLRYDLLFGKLRPYFHKIIIAPFNGICSTDILVIRSLEPHWYSLMTLGLSQESVVDNVTNQSEGTRMPRTNWNQVGSQPIVIPSKKVAIAFDALILPMLQRVVEMAHENRHLSELRDTQLPRLISGKIRLNQPEDAAA
ncbi:restriction endonuclease subunit S [Thiolapillus sp.]|uniref:restriction endonuclease subunit S n=6 Tax=Thiolapillus sp. TaxID=2017437 RepID=UPI003AF88E4D